MATTDWGIPRERAHAAGGRQLAGANAPRGARITLFYVMIWAILAVGAISYLAVLAVRPDLMALFKSISPGTQEPNQRAMTRALAEVDGLKQSVTQLRADVGSVKEVLSQRDDRDGAVTTLRSDVVDLRAALAEHEERERILSGRVAAVEAQQTVAHMGTATQRAATAPFSTSSGGPSGTMVTGQIDEAPAKPARAAAKAVDETKLAQPQTAMASATTSFAAVKVKPAGPAALQLAAGSTPDDLRLSWLKLTATHGAALQGLEPRYITIKKGTAATYRLVAGPVASSEEATRLCSQLKAQKLTCSVGLFGGQPL